MGRVTCTLERAAMTMPPMIREMAVPPTKPIFRMAMARGSFSRGKVSASRE